MPLRLHTKQEIDQAKAQERTKAVQEGLGIAQRVDVLRETQATEEASLGEFRSKTISAIQEEVDGITNRRDLLADEVIGLEQRKADALVPLDDAWKAVRTAEEAVRADQDQLAHDRSALEADQIKLATDRSVYENDCKLLKEGSDEVNALMVKTEAINEEARSNRADAQQTLTDAQEYQRRTEKELGDREAGLTATEERQQKRDREQDARELDLNQRETLLTDREGLLERDIKRSKS